MQLAVGRKKGFWLLLPCLFRECGLDEEEKPGQPATVLCFLGGGRNRSALLSHCVLCVCFRGDDLLKNIRGSEHL